MGVRGEGSGECLPPCPPPLCAGLIENLNLNISQFTLAIYLPIYPGIYLKKIMTTDHLINKA